MVHYDFAHFFFRYYIDRPLSIMRVQVEIRFIKLDLDAIGVNWQGYAPLDFLPGERRLKIITHPSRLDRRKTLCFKTGENPFIFLKG